MIWMRKSMNRSSVVFIITAVALQASLVASASCGQPDLTLDIVRDRNGDGVLNGLDAGLPAGDAPVVTFDRCATVSIPGDFRLTIYYTTENGLPVDQLEQFSGNTIATVTLFWVNLAWTRYKEYGAADPRESKHVAGILWGEVGRDGGCCLYYPTEDIYTFGIRAATAQWAFDNGKIERLASIGAHELWHTIYSAGGQWIVEGQATWAEDKVHLDVDNSELTGYYSRVGIYKRGQFATSLPSLAYNAGIFWTYFTEQVGTLTGEPRLGFDAMVSLWDVGNFATDNSVFQSIENLAGVEFEDFFANFGASNYAMELDGPVPDILRNRDAEQGQTAGLPYPNLIPTCTFPCDSSSFSMDRWANNYLIIPISDSWTRYQFALRNPVSGTSKYTIIRSKDGRYVDHTRSNAREYFHDSDDDSTNVDEIAIVVTSLSAPISYTFAINSFNGGPGLSVPTPVPTPCPPSCFSGGSTVRVQGKGSIPMEELKIGDYVETSNGEFSRVYSFAHKDPTEETYYIQLFTTNSSEPLEISENHMLYVGDRLVPANRVRVGDELDQDQVVDRLGNVKRRGMYAPLTETGTIMVSGIRASNYITLLDIDSGLQAWLFHAILSPVRVVCGLNMSVCEQETYTNGYSVYVFGWLNLAHKVSSMHRFLQVMMVVATSPFLVGLLALEKLLALLSRAAVVVAVLLVYLAKSRMASTPTKGKKKSLLHHE